MQLQSSPLLTDLYQLTMLHAYYQQRMAETAVFEFFVRRMPSDRGFLLAAGLEQALIFLEDLCFSAEELDWIAGHRYFNQAFADFLADLRFTGDVHAMPEGTVFFPDEPILRVTAPIPQAQLVETRLINILHCQTLIASKAARCVLAAPGKLLVDFGLRRAHGAEAGMFAARASYLAGFGGSSTVLAEAEYGIPSFGTMAHSFVQAHTLETEAFEHFSHAQPDNVVLLIDTYDTEAAAHKVVNLADRLRAQGIPVKAVRLDSGDLVAHARRVREILDAGGLTEVGIFCSGDLEEHELHRLLAAGAPIDGFGVGTRMDTSADAPYLNCAYKLQEYAGSPRRKRSEGKATWPGRKQVYRTYNDAGTMTGDLLTLASDKQPGEALIVPVMRGGRCVEPRPGLEDARRRTAAELARLPAQLRELGTEPAYPLTVADALQALAAEVDRQGH